MENIEYSNSLYQINEILKFIEPNLRERIPKKIISYFENNKSQDYSWNIDRELPLTEQELLPTTKEILTVLYKDYICNDIERINLEKILKENEMKYQNQLKEKYNTDNLFKNKQDKSIEIETKNVSVIDYKKSLLKKIIEKIKMIFKN